MLFLVIALVVLLALACWLVVTGTPAAPPPAPLPQTFLLPSTPLAPIPRAPESSPQTVTKTLEVRAVRRFPPRFIGTSKDVVVSKLLQTYPNFTVVPVQFGKAEPTDYVANRLVVTYDDWTGRVVSIQNK